MKFRNVLCSVFLSLLFITSLGSAAQEICDNGRDDDGDGLTDLQDPECQCYFHAPANLLQNGSFEVYENCPTNYSFDQDSKLVRYWQYGTYTNMNEAIYYHNAACATDWAQVLFYIPPALPLPNGNAFISVRQSVYRKPNMQETDIAKTYIGQCLQNALKPGEQYSFTFRAGRFQSNDDRDFKFKTEPFTVAIFGHSDCNAVPFGQRNAYSNGCPAHYPGWVLLGTTTLMSKGMWVQGRIDFTVPHDISVVMIGPDCSIIAPPTDLTDSTTVSDFYTYYLDDVQLLPTNDFHFPHIQSAAGGACIEGSVLYAPVTANANYQWYKNGVAITGATRISYTVPDTDRAATFNVRLTANGACIISEPFSFAGRQLSALRLPTDTLLCLGDSVLIAPPINGIVYKWNGIENTKVQVNAPGVYNIIAQANGCTKSFTVKVQAVDCANEKIYMPTAFTPNGDGKNDVFRVPPEENFKVKTFLVYDRWGNSIFSTKSSTGWDGIFKGKQSPPGSYVYFIRGTLNNRERLIKGTVLLIR